MTTPSADYGPESLLAESERLARQVRGVQRATWFPLLILGLVTLAAIPVYGFSSRALACRSGGAEPLATRVCAVSVPAAFIYWPIALVLAYLAIAAFYLRRAHARGVGTRVRPFVVAGIALAVLLTLAAIWAAHHPPVGNGSILGVRLGPEEYSLFNRLVSAASAIGFALLVLARVERSRALGRRRRLPGLRAAAPERARRGADPPIAVAVPPAPADRGSDPPGGRRRVRARPAAAAPRSRMSDHPANGLDDVVHQRVRLGILTVAHEARQVEFGYLRSSLGLTAGNLSQHLSVLEKAGLVTIDKGYADKRARTWITLTKAGDAALRAEIAQLKLLIHQVEGSPPGSPTPG